MKRFSFAALLVLSGFFSQAQVLNVLQSANANVAKKCKFAVDGQWCIIKGDGVVTYPMNVDGYRRCMDDWKSMKEKMDKLYGHGRQVKFEAVIPLELVEYSSDDRVMSDGMVDGSVTYKICHEYTTGWGVVILILSMDNDGYSTLMAVPRNH